MSFESEQENLRRRGLESRESGQESKEGSEDVEAMKKSAAMERADYLVKEVKTSQQQMQNIVRHMQEVQQAIRQLRAQLQLVQQDKDDASVAQDKKKIGELKNKISDYAGELGKMRDDLVREQTEELQGNIEVDLSAEELKQKSEEMVDEMINEIKS